MEKILLYIAICLLACAIESCDSEDQPTMTDEEYVEVQLSIPGNYGNPFLPSTRADYDYIKDLDKYKPGNLPEGATVWLLLEELENVDDSANIDITYYAKATLKSFVVDNNGLLMPCVADDDGNLVERTTKPLYLKRNQWYRARVIGPARKLTSDYSMYITNNQYVYAHDNRYTQTRQKTFKVGYDKPVEKITLNPVINQTAELRFTIEAENDTYEVDGEDIEYSPVHSLEVMPAGVVVTGLQEHYSLGTKDGEAYNWTLCTNYLYAYPGKVYNYMTIYDPVETSGNPPKLVFRGAIMPTDAVATPIIVGFYLRVNGVPTQFQMMLNRKRFLNAYYYHYKGKIKIQRGVAVLEWQTVTREIDVDLPVINQ